MAGFSWLPVCALELQSHYYGKQHESNHQVCLDIISAGLLVPAVDVIYLPT